jgi:phosphoribosylaminoimidazole carboxylase (NCAIR synthetase)
VDASALRRPRRADAPSRACDVITFEFENIPADALDVLSRTTSLYPDRRALEVSQDRLTEKRFLTDLGLTTAPFAPIDNAGRPAARWPRPAPRDPEDPALRL